jgi:N-acetylmuramoyl-L-alanine amidase
MNIFIKIAASLVFIVAIALVGLNKSHYTYIADSFEQAGEELAAVFFTPSVTVRDLREHYDKAEKKSLMRKSGGAERLKILIMPGHEPFSGGTSFKGMQEKDIAVTLAKKLALKLSADPHFEVIVARDYTSWHPSIAEYFDTHWEEIKNFRLGQKAEMAKLVSEGKIVKKTDGIVHNNAPEASAIRLFGINKWVNENGVDIAIHIHFNDYPRGNRGAPGEYSGFTIYVPDWQYSNAEATKVMAKAVFARLSRLFATSDLPQEQDGVVEDQDLIAIGQSNTVDAASMLIEYGYIYEPMITNDMVREAVLDEMALQTYLGVEDFFGGKIVGSMPTGGRFGSTLLPHTWTTKIISATSAQSFDVISLQAALTVEGMYPPAGRTKNECPVSGTFGNCTQAALAAFQSKYGISGEQGIIGEKTLAKLNELFGK